MEADAVKHEIEWTSKKANKQVQKSHTERKKKENTNKWNTQRLALEYTAKLKGNNWMIRHVNNETRIGALNFNLINACSQ